MKEPGNSPVDGSRRPERPTGGNGEGADAVSANSAEKPGARPARGGRHPIRIMGAGEEGSRVEAEPTSRGASVAPGGGERPEGRGERPPSPQPQPRPGDTGGEPGGNHKVRVDLRQDEVVRGMRPGDRYIRQVRNVGPFRRSAPGVLRASLDASRARTRWGRAFSAIKRVVLGPPISTEHSIHERLTIPKGLAVLSSDPLSSVAYATEEILRVLLLAGAGAIAALTMPIGLAIVGLLLIVVISYRQTIAAYPRGGGSYIVTKENLGTLPGLTAAASILIDYTMTVAVSVSAGIAAIYSLFPEVKEHRVEICLAVVILITIVNLRGVRESGNIFALPTYLFIVGIVGMVVYGMLRVYLGVNGQPTYIAPREVIPYGTEYLSLFLVLRAFTQGCTALTGVEAIADGVPAFKPPEAGNARKTLGIMVVVAIGMFSGITLLAGSLHIRPSEEETVLSQLARTIFPEMLDANPLWFYIQISTALILVLAANTAFADFPRLSYFLARDKFMPRQYSFRGDKLAFSWGIITLAVLACVLIMAFNGETTALIPLYTVGVFNSFTLSQSGMVVRWWRTRSAGWKRNLAINGLGALTTGLVLIVSAITKFEYGAWVVIVLIPVLIVIFLGIHGHYTRVEEEERLAANALPAGPRSFKHTFVVPVARLNPATLTALHYARSLSSNVTAVHVMEGEEGEAAEEFKREWDRLLGSTDIGLVMIESPFRSLVGPLLAYIDALDRQVEDDTVTIILPEVLPTRPWEYMLHNQNALRLKAALLFRPNTVLADMPYLLGGRRMAEGSGEGGWLPAGFRWGALFVLLAALYVAYRYLFNG